MSLGFRWIILLDSQQYLATFFEEEATAVATYNSLVSQLPDRNLELVKVELVRVDNG